MTAAREIYKHACLQALGMPLLVARRPLPGAAPSCAPLPASALMPLAPQPSPPRVEPPPRVDSLPRVESPPRGRQPTADSLADSPSAAIVPPTARPVRFSLAVVRSADCLWLEALMGAGMSAPQRQLLGAMAAAVEGRAAELREMPFDWPLHDNPQLDRSAEAAGAALDGFLRRQLEERPCRAICLLGSDAPLGLVPENLGVPLLWLPATREMLEEPLRKREAWQVLAPLHQASLSG